MKLDRDNTIIVMCAKFDLKKKTDYYYVSIVHLLS